MLSDKQERFCREYIIDQNATQAAIRAGYSERSAKSQGSRLLTYADVAARVRELQQNAAKTLGITAAGVLAKIQTVVNRCMTAEPVMEYDQELGELIKTGEYKFDSRGAVKALELLGKHLGLFVDKTEISGRDGEALSVVFRIPRPGDTPESSDSG